MKTIEMKVGNSVVYFTTKSVTIDGAEFFYGKMSEIKHSASKHVYAFKYNDEVRYLPYDPKYEKALKAIFAQVNSLHHDGVTGKTSAPVSESTNATPVEGSESTTVEASNVSEATSEVDDNAANTEIAQMVAGSLMSSDDNSSADDSSEEESENYELKAEEAGSLMGEHAFSTEDADKKGKKRKAIIVLAAMIVLIGLLSVGYFMIFGTSSNPSTSTNSTQTQQYDDIDQLIDDLNDK